MLREPGSRNGGLENRDSGAKCRYPIFKLENYGRNQIDGNLRMTVKSHAFSIDIRMSAIDILLRLRKSKTAKTTRLGSTLRIFDEKFGPPNAFV